MHLVIKGIRSESLADTLAAAGHTLNQGDAILLQVSSGKAIGVAPYSEATLIEASQLSSGAKIKVFRAESISLDGKGPIYRNVTKEYAPQIAKAEGKNFAAAAGKEGVGGEHIVSFSDIIDDVTEGKDLFRGDDLQYSSKRPNGISKSYVNSSGDLMPANVEGMYHGREVTVIEHVLGGFRKGAKANSPYTSFSSDQGISNKYGDSTIKVDVARLGNDIRSGQIKDVEILSPQQVLDAIKSDIRESSYWKNLALKWAQRDNEYLIKGVIPQEYITIK